MRRLVAFSCLLAVVVSCGETTAAPEQPPTRRPPEVAAVVTERAPAPPVAIAAAIEEDLYEGFAISGQSDETLVALTRGETDVYPAPGAAEASRTLPATTILGTATVVTAIGQPVDGWLEVMIPGRPNGATGWIETGRVDLYIVTDRVVIDLSDRELVYFSDGVERLRAPVAIGTSHNPTPTGEFFVTDLVSIPGGGPWGPAALGLSARSETITEFNGGDGIIGIHGTNKPSSIGQAASLGCVRLNNDVISELRELISLGTPVEIRA